jgi:hypothetical protein
MIEEQHLDQLRAAGLFVSHPIPAFGGGYWICKPNSTPGNNAPGLDFGFITLEPEPPCPELDAPMLKFMFRMGQWIVDGIDEGGSPESADFSNKWSTPSEAVRDILDFYFGDPTRMQKKAERRYAAKQRAIEFNKKKSQQMRDER